MDSRMAGGIFSICSRFCHAPWLAWVTRCLCKLYITCFEPPNSERPKKLEAAFKIVTSTSSSHSAAKGDCPLRLKCKDRLQGPMTWPGSLDTTTQHGGYSFYRQGSRTPLVAPSIKWNQTIGTHTFDMSIAIAKAAHITYSCISTCARCSLARWRKDVCERSPSQGWAWK